MDKDKNLLENEQLFKNLFEYSDDKDEKLYKNDLFIPSTEEEEIFKKNTNKNQSEIFRDKILKKLSLEDYIIFPPKNDSILITDNEVGKDKEDQEKLFEEEIDHLRNLHRLNYLTFSPFGLSFFPNLNSMVDEEQHKYNTHETEEELNEKENKILNIIDFDYNNYEINNDLLFNISMGFIDMTKLKKENVVSSDVFVPRSERFNNGRKLVNKFVRKKEEKKKIFEYDVEFKSDLMENILKFVNKNEKIEFFSKTINNFYKEYTQIQNMNKNIEKNKLLLKWDKIFKDRQKMYKHYLVELEKKERQKRRQQKIQKEIDERIYREKIKKYEQEKEFENELEKIRKKGLKELRRNSLMNPKKNINLSLHNSISCLSEIFENSNNKIKNDSISSFDKSKPKRRHGKTVYQKKRKENNEERVEWLKTKNDYYFFNL